MASIDYAKLMMFSQQKERRKHETCWLDLLTHFHMQIYNWKKKIKMKIIPAYDARTSVDSI